MFKMFIKRSFMKDVNFTEYEVYDAKDKILGRLASVVAKCVLKGKNVVVINAEQSIISGNKKDIIEKYNFDNDHYGDPNLEGRVLSTYFKNFILVNVYTPNAKDDLSRLALRHQKWDPAFIEYMKLLEKDKPVIFCGDLNVAHTEQDLANPKPNAGKKGFTDEEREGIDNMLAAGFVDSLREFKHGNGYYTWWSFFANSRARNVGWRIDYIMISKRIQDKLRDANIHPEILGSDHCPVSVSVDIDE